MSNTAIKVENLSKIYRLGEIGTGTISRDMERWFKTKVLKQEDPFLRVGETNDRTNKGSSNIVYSLQDVNFEIKQGDAVGIIGRNGAGKSTLLKIISRVTTPTKGRINLRGRVASLLEVGTGFHPELTGRENIYLNGAILGMRKKEIDRKLDEIIDFSGVERYVDTPVKRYSSGMYVRLAFAVAAHLESEILIVDEVLAVGDAEFQKKCLGKMGDVSQKEGRTVLFVSHNMGSVVNLCNKGILLLNGKLSKTGTMREVVNEYMGEIGLVKNEYTNPTPPPQGGYISEIKIINIISGQQQATFFHNEAIGIAFDLEIDENKSEEYMVFCTVVNASNNKVFSSETTISKGRSVLVIPAKTLVRGKYFIDARIHIPQIRVAHSVEGVCLFTIVDNGSEFLKHGDFDYGSVFVEAKWHKK